MIKINVENNEKRQEIQAFVEENGGKVLPYQDKKIMCVDFVGIPLTQKMPLLNELKRI